MNRKRPDVIVIDDIQDPTSPPHQWRSPMLVPVCLWCGKTSLQALAEQPETRGVGPCHEREKRALERLTQDNLPK